ncbi:MAG: sulfite exporter TauE/SafE family protein, partial [Pseudomonadota bacterium]
MIGRIRVATSHGFSAIIAPAAMEIDQTLIAYALAGGAVGGLVRGYSGFGFAMAAVPIMAIGISPAIAVPSVLVHELAIGLFSLKSERKRADLSLLRWMCLGSLVGTPLGLFALSQIPDQVMRIAIGLVLLLSVLALWVFRSRSVALRPPLLSGAGFASGLLNGSTAMSGPPVVLTLLGSALLPAHVRGLSIYFIAFSAAIGVGISMLSGMQTQAGLVLVLLMIPGVIAGVL